MWLFIPSLYSRVCADSTSALSLPWDQYSRSVTLSGKSPQPKSLQRACATGRWHLLQFGAISQPSMEAAFEVWLTSLAADSPVRICQSLEGKKESTQSTADCGSSTCESSGKCSPASCSLRMFRRSSDTVTTPMVAEWNPETHQMESPQMGLFATSMPWRGRYPKSGMTANGSVFERPTWERPTAESACSSWPTPDTGESLTGHGARGGNGTNGHQSGVDLKSTAQTWKTPHGMGGIDATGKRGGPGGGEFAKQANQWETPRAEMAEHPGRTTDSGAQAHMECQANLWQTPATDSFRSRGGERKDEMGLDQQARLMLRLDAQSVAPVLFGRDCCEPERSAKDAVSRFPTPSARDWRDGRASQETTESNARPLNEFVLNEMENWPTPRVTTSAMEPSEAQLSRIRSGEESERGAGACKLEISVSLFSRPDPPTPKDGEGSSPTTPGSRRPSARKKLNAYFVEMLMGLPPGWTSMLPLGQIDSER